MKKFALILIASLGLTGCIVYDDGMPPPRNHLMFYDARIGYSHTYHAHRHVHYMPERGPTGHPGAKHPNTPKPAAPAHGPSRRNMPATVR